MKRQRRNKKQNVSGCKEILTAIPLIILSVFICGNYFSSFVAKAAVISAGIMLPQGAVGTVYKSIQNSNENNNTQNTIEVPTVISDEPSEQTVNSVKKSDIPEDIQKMVREAQLQYSDYTHDGVIVEKQYDASSATSTFQNITVRNTTSSHSINIESSLNQKPTINITDKTQPTVLIFHTHTTESYQMLNNDWYTTEYPTRSNDLTRNMARVGTAICEELEKSGIGYIHDTEIHDTAYTGAYDRSRETILKIMKENPSIQIVLDVHRDAIEQKDGTRIKPTAVINNKKAAQIMIIAGCEDGKVSSFPSWEQNLTFALQLHKKAETLYPGLMRPILFSARKYNMDVIPCSVLLEFGSDSNTLAEAEYSGHLMGRAIAEFVNSNTAT